MDTINLNDLTSGYRERMRRLALMEPLDELAGKRTEDDNGARLDMRGLGMLTLLFFFERRLSRSYQTSRTHVTEFLLKMTQDTYKISYENMEKVTKIIMDIFRPTAGEKHHFAYFNWETKEQEEIAYSILKANDFDAKTDTQFYTLAEDGLELLFATKEFYSEFQISINQLLLKQQIKKGEFHDALRQVREMELNVTTLIERFEKMRQEIVRSIVSNQTFERYQNLIEEAHERFEREDEEFKSLKQFIQETRDTFYRGDFKTEEKASYELIHKIAQELDEVHYEHTRLIELTVQLSNTAIATAQQSLYYTGVQSFNFEKDIVATIFGKPMSPDTMKGVIQPFIKVEQNPSWSLLTIVEDQNITEEGKGKATTDFLAPTEDLVQKEYRTWLAEKYHMLIEKFIKAYETNQIDNLRDWMEDLRETDPSLIEKRYFYSFWLYMHQNSPITPNRETENDKESIARVIVQALGRRQMTVEELPDIIQLYEKYSIQNMKITLEEQTAWTTEN